jgi:peptidoglycan/xylan/chitin deacetylase (PgdA/CDA1 family)
MRLLTLPILFIFLFSLSFGQIKHICFSIDDMPVVNYKITDSSYQKKLMDNLIHSLKDNNIPAIGFVNGRKLYDEKGLINFQIEMLKNWINNGLELGNHTYSHFDYNTTSFNDFTLDILKGETNLKELLGAKGYSLKYFRHPFLHVGDTKEKADSLSAFLSIRGYKIAPVTIDNEDYLFAVAYHRANVKNNKDLMLKIGHDYIDYMEKKTKYYEVQSQKLFGRNINQILLIHASLLNSDYVDSLAVMFKRNGYDFICMDKTLQDDAYKTEITVFDKWGISWLDKWALSQGKRKDFFKDEPVTPDYINKLAE